MKHNLRRAFLLCVLSLLATPRGHAQSAIPGALSGRAPAPATQAAPTQAPAPAPAVVQPQAPVPSPAPAAVQPQAPAPAPAAVVQPQARAAVQPPVPVAAQQKLPAAAAPGAPAPGAAPAGAPGELPYPWTMNLQSNPQHPFLTYDAVSATHGGDPSAPAPAARPGVNARAPAAPAAAPAAPAPVKDIGIKLDLQIRNSGQGPGAVRVRWILFSTPDGKVIVGAGQRDLILQPGKSEAWSPGGHNAIYSTLGQGYANSYPVGGWLVQFFTAPGQLAKQIGSSGTIETAGKDLTTLDFMIKRYEKVQGRRLLTSF